jgi:NAD(P)-dependent dehydrogenase (short-subunit alcohol dehydrogenase family)
MDIADKTVLVTGASQGLGLALATELSRRGAKVALVARDEGRLTEVVSGLRRTGAHVLGIAEDIGSKQAIHRIVARAQAELGPTAVLIHNASTLGPVPLALLADTECEDFQRALEVNVLGPFRLSRALASGMIVRGQGEIVHVSSDAAVEAYPRWGAYGASKAALDHLSRTWAAELEASGVRVWSVDPGEMRTRMHHQAVPDADPSTLRDPHEVACSIVDKLGQVPSGARLRIALAGAKS